MLKVWYYIFIFGLCFFNSGIAHAEELPSIGKFAAQLLEPVGILGDFIGSASMIIGVACIFASFLRYMQYRVNHFTSPLSTVIMLFIIGILLLCLPFIYMLTGTGVPFPHNK